MTWLEGLGASYRIKGFFALRSDSGIESRIEFEAVAFGGNYGGHNVNVKVVDSVTDELLRTRNCTESDIDELISEVQRKLLNNEMIVEYDKLKPEAPDDDPLKLG